MPTEFNFFLSVIQDDYALRRNFYETKYLKMKSKIYHIERKRFSYPFFRVRLRNN